jgi:hypothetical protein
VNAVCDALQPFGIRHIDKPLTPARVWAAIQAAEQRGGYPSTGGWAAGRDGKGATV